MRRGKKMLALVLVCCMVYGSSARAEEVYAQPEQSEKMSEDVSGEEIAEVKEQEEQQSAETEKEEPAEAEKEEPAEAEVKEPTEKEEQEPAAQEQEPEEEQTAAPIVKNPEGGLVVNDSADPASEGQEHIERFSGAEREGRTGKATPLDAGAVDFHSIYQACRQIPCEERGGIYFLNGTSLSFLKLDTNKLTAVYTFDAGYDIYEANDKLYCLTYGGTITVYNLLTQTVEKVLECKQPATAIGVDSSGRIYLAGETERETMIYLLSASGELLSQTASKEKIYSFGGFDSSNGNFYVEGYDNWVYWGYDHDMHALRAGNVSGNTISFEETILTYVCQSYWYERQNQVTMLGDQYLCMDNTFYAGLSIWDSDKYVPSNPADTELLYLQRDNKESGDFDRYCCVGTRTVYRENTDSIITFKNNSCISEYQVKTGKEMASMETDYPVFSLMAYKDGVIAIEKSGNEYYYEYIPWKPAAHIEITGSSTTVNVGQTLQLTANADGTLTENYIWSSSNVKIASVNEEGLVFGWSKGTATITVTTQGGVSAEYTVTVNPESAVISPENPVIYSSGSKSNNQSANDYTVWSKTVNSYLTQNADGSITRVEHFDNKLIIEAYGSDGKIVNTHTVKKELDLFGGFYSGVKYNYFVFGQVNCDESDGTEVLRIVKYSKKYERLGAISVSGANTYVPFDAGSLRMTEAQGKLYIHTCHTMYTSEDDLNHQANMTFVVNEEKMTVEQSYYDVMNIAQAGYVSHSFNQFVKADDDYVYRVDHGDASPRGVSITKCVVGGDITNVTYTIPVSLENVQAPHYNATGASVGGFELSSKNCIVAGNAVDYAQENINAGAQRNIFVSVTDKKFSHSKTVWLTQYTGGENIVVRTPHLVKIGTDQFLVMWEESDTVSGKSWTKMITIDDGGNTTSDVVRTAMALSDCAPVYCDDRMVRWYTTHDSSPVIYTVNPLELAALYTKGDINEDGTVDIQDLRVVLQGICEKVQLTELQKKRADVVTDGKVDIRDLRKLLRFVCGKDTEI